MAQAEVCLRTPASVLPSSKRGTATAQNYFICFERRKPCTIVLTNSDNGELAFQPILEHILGDTVTPWEWEGYTQSYLEASRKGSN